ncbi:MAG: hypothetical protein ACJ77B_01900 [Chloroflexota bacterium]
MRSRDLRRPVAVAVILGLGSALVLATAVVAPNLLGRIDPPRVSPTVYYAVESALATTLFELRLDGESPARAVASRPSSEEAHVTFDVDPAARRALAIETTETSGSIDAVDVATGTLRWRLEIADPPAAPSVWSSDGSRWAALTFAANGTNGVVLVEVDRGTARSMPIPDGMRPQGFDRHGALVLVEDVPAQQIQSAWRFSLLDWETGAVRAAAPSEAETGPHSDVHEDVAPAAKIGLGYTPDDDEGQSTLVIATLDGAISTRLESLPDAPWSAVAFTPNVDAVIALAHAAGANNGATATLARFDLDGRRRILAEGLPPYSDIAMSPDGTLIGLTGWDESVAESVMSVVDTRVPRVIRLPIPRRTVEARIVAVVGGTTGTTIAVAPSAPPAATPRPVTAIRGAPELLASWLETVDDRNVVTHVELLAPANEGGVVGVAQMPPVAVSLGLADPENRTLEVVPRPGTDEILVFVGDGTTHSAMLWTPGERTAPLALPPGMPAHIWGPKWRSDGEALAFQAEVGDADSTTAVIASFELRAPHATITKFRGDYSDLAGWAPNGRDFVVMHGVCTEGCDFRYAYYATIEPGGRVHPVEPAGTVLGLAAYGALFDDPTHRITLSSIEREDRDDIRIPWPAALPALGAGFSTLVSPNGRDLIVLAPTDDGVEVYVVADPLAKAVKGVAAVTPREIGRLPLGVQVAGVSGGLDWVIVTDRAGVSSVVELATGTVHEVSDDEHRQLRWANPG